MSINWSQSSENSTFESITTNSIYNATSAGTTIYDDLIVNDGFIAKGASLFEDDITGESIFLTGGLQADVSVLTDTINEVTTDNGVLIDGVQCKDSAIVMVNSNTPITGYTQETASVTMERSSTTKGTLTMKFRRLEEMIVCSWSYTHLTDTGIGYVDSATPLATRFRPTYAVRHRQGQSSTLNDDWVTLSVSTGGVIILSLNNWAGAADTFSSGQNIQGQVSWVCEQVF